MNSEYQTPPHPDPLKWSHVRIQRGDRGSAPLLENQKFYGFLEFAFGPPAPAPGIGWTPPPPETL